MTSRRSSPALTSWTRLRPRACILGGAGRRPLGRNSPRAEHTFLDLHLFELGDVMANAATETTGRMTSRRSSPALTSWTRLRPRACILGGAGGRPLGKDSLRAEHIVVDLDLIEMGDVAANAATGTTGRLTSRRSSPALTSWTRLRPRACILGGAGGRPLDRDPPRAEDVFVDIFVNLDLIELGDVAASAATMKEILTPTLRVLDFSMMSGGCTRITGMIGTGQRDCSPALTPRPPRRRARACNLGGAVTWTATVGDLGSLRRINHWPWRREAPRTELTGIGVMRSRCIVVRSRLNSPALTSGPHLRPRA